MAIETLQDYIAQASCCCPPPLCPIIEQICESATGESGDQYGYFPWVRPTGADDDPTPFLYLSGDWGGDYIQYGTAAWYQGWNENPTVADNWAELLDIAVMTGDVTPGAWTSEQTGNFTLLDDGTHSTPIPIANSFSGLDGRPSFIYIFTGGASDFCWDEGSSDSATVLVPANTSRTDTVWTQAQDKIQYIKGTGVPSLQGAGGADNLFDQYWDVTTEQTLTATLTGPFTRMDVLNDAVAAAGGWDGEVCEASCEVSWPNIENIHVTYPQDPGTGPWGEDFRATASIVKVRYRWRIPSTWVDPVTGATVAFPGTYFKIVCDVINEPDGWDDTIDDPDYEPPVPNDPPEPIPQVPKPGRPVRTWYAEDNEAIWIGPGTGDQDDPSWFTDYFYINAPTSFVGRRYVVNVRYICREDWGLGVLPQVIGEAVTLPDPE